MTSDYFYAVLLGTVQGLTEFLPISSTGHLTIAQELFDLSPSTFGLQFDAAIHLGTMAAIVWFFRKDLWDIVRHLDRPFERRLLLYLVLATIPAATLGLMFEEAIEGPLRNLGLIAVMLILGGFVFLWVERVAKKRKTIKQATWKDALTIGFAQALALIPGVSRSGATIVAGMLLGLERAAAARFAFLLSVPIVVGAGGAQLLRIASDPVSGTRMDVTMVGLLTSGIVGYLTIKFFLRYLAHHGLGVFAYYRFALGALILAVLFLG